MSSLNAFVLRVSYISDFYLRSSWVKYDYQGFNTRKNVGISSQMSEDILIEGRPAQGVHETKKVGNHCISGSVVSV